ncbi:CGNR zinc finger domain-containing protein [Burkholderia pseudomallei]|nr:CGNR zinc finger domain-containing protein [Burkholderia pseudomallei]
MVDRRLHGPIHSERYRSGDECTAHTATRSSRRKVTGTAASNHVSEIASGEWSRLKPCPDCQWAFYHRTRNGSKRWCGMTKGGPGGRACGTIAKAAAYHTREARQDKCN